MTCMHEVPYIIEIRFPPVLNQPIHEQPTRTVRSRQHRMPKHKTLKLDMYARACVCKCNK